MELLIFPIAIFMVMIFVALDGWRKDSIIRSTSEQELIAELKRRAILRKLEAQASAEVDDIVQRATVGQGALK